MNTSNSTSVASKNATAASPNLLGNQPKMVSIGGMQRDVTQKQYKGILNRVRTRTDSGFTVCVVGTITCVGMMHETHVGAEYLMDGEYVEDGRWGWQFKFSKYQYFLDASKGFRELLVREAPNIGPQLAAKLVSYFRDDLLNVIEHKPDQVAQIPGMNHTKAKELQNWATEHRSNNLLKEKLYKIGLFPAQVARLIAHYGPRAEDKIRRDCFSLTEVKGFGFITVAKIADMIGIPKDDKGRIKACLFYTVAFLCNEGGHICIAATELLGQACKVLQLNQAQVSPVLEKMISDEEIISSEVDWMEYAKGLGRIYT